MPRKQKLSPEEKVKMILAYVGGEIGRNEAARRCGGRLCALIRQLPA